MSNSNSISQLFDLTSSSYLFHGTPSFIIAGGYAFQHEFYDDIIEYHPEEDTMTPVGHMTEARYKHAVSVVKADDYLQWCQ